MCSKAVKEVIAEGGDYTTLMGKITSFTKKAKVVRSSKGNLSYTLQMWLHHFGDSKHHVKRFQKARNGKL